MLSNEISFQIHSAMAEQGLNCPIPFIPDSKFHRFGADGDKNKKPCWYVVHVINDNLVYAAFGCWRRGISETWCNRDTKNLSSQERTLIKQKQEQLKRKLQEQQTKAKNRANYIWEHAQQNFSDHPYLVRKRVKSYGLRFYKRMLLVPLYNENNELCSLQFITLDSAKRFKKNALMKGCFFLIGNIGATICISEGYATGATIHEATGYGVVVAFNAYNLLPVAQIIRKKYPNAEIIICADNDAFGGVK